MDGLCHRFMDGITPPSDGWLNVGRNTLMFDRSLKYDLMVEGAPWCLKDDLILKSIT